MKAPLSDDQLFEGFDRVASRLGIRPPNSPGEQLIVAGWMKWFVLGVRWREHVANHQDSLGPQFSLPGIDFDPTQAMEEIERNRKKH